MRLHRGDEHSRYADAVAAHQDRLLLLVLVQKGRTQRDGVSAPELENMAELDRRACLQHAAVVLR